MPTVSAENFQYSATRIYSRVAHMLERKTICGDRHKRTPLGRGCAKCGTELFARNRRDFLRKKFCSYKCAGQDSVLARQTIDFAKSERKCANCESPFIGSRSMKYCSVRCASNRASQAYRQRKSTVEGHMGKLLHGRNRQKLSREFLVDLYNRQSGKCALSGVQMTTSVGSGKVGTNISIDRIQPKGEYEPSNVRLVCYIVNVMRRDLEDDVFLRWCAAITTISRVRA